MKLLNDLHTPWKGCSHEISRAENWQSQKSFEKVAKLCESVGQCNRFTTWRHGHVVSIACFSATLCNWHIRRSRLLILCYGHQIIVLRNCIGYFIDSRKWCAGTLVLFSLKTADTDSTQLIQYFNTSKHVGELNNFAVWLHYWLVRQEGTLWDSRRNWTIACSVKHLWRVWMPLSLSVCKFPRCLNHLL